MRLHPTLFLLTHTFFFTCSIAAAEIKTLRGSITNDPGSKITIKIQRLGGRPFKVRSFDFKDVSFRCFGNTPPGRISGKIGRMEVTRRQNPFSTKLETTNVYASASDQLTTDKKIGVFISGITNDRASKTSGNFGISFGDGCSEGGPQGFKKFQARN